MRIALAQINPIVGDLQKNRALIEDYIKKAKKLEADIVVFPELAVCGYPPEDLLYKEHFVRDNLKSLRALVKSVKGITAVVGFVDRDKSKNLYNAAAVIANGKLQGVYRKEELPNYGVFDEKRYFRRGKNNKKFNILQVQVDINICEDIWVDPPRKVFKGTKLVINISSSPFDVGKLAQRQRLLKKCAKHTKAFVAYINLVGGQDELVFDGSSMIVDPKGQIVASGKSFEEDLIVADLKIGKPQKKSPIMKHLSKKGSQIERIYKALVLGTHDYAKKNGFHKAVIGISGGIDSSLVAAVAVDALGKENVIGMAMPSRYSSKGTVEDAKRLAKNLGIKLIEIPIEGVFKAYQKALSKEFKGLKSNIAEENIQARIRGNLLMALSNKFGLLVLTTGNKSETAVGYCTLYGDMSGGFAMIKDVPKTKVYKLVEFRNNERVVIPKSILKRAPSAELRENQKDQDSLPDYAVLDDLLSDYVENHRSLAHMSKRKGKDLAKKIIQMVDLSEYKRRQAPPGIKITPRAFGRDWRLPITNKYKEF